MPAPPVHRPPAQSRRSAPSSHPDRRRSAARKKKAQTRKIDAAIAVLVVAAVLVVGVLLQQLGLIQMWKLHRDAVPDWVDVQILDITAGGRRMARLEGVRDIAIHYVANPGSSAQQNRDFFDQPQTPVSAHFVVGLDGEVIQCLPLEEKSSATNERNRDTISIEVCHPAADGKFAPATYASLVRLTAWLCDYTGIGRDHVIRHYDVTGKLCPLYYVEHPEAWEQFLLDVAHEK